MNVELVSKTVPNKEYFHDKLQELILEDEISLIEANEIKENLDAEELMIYIARVSSSRANKLEDYEKLLNYLIDNAHWSPFEHAYMTVEIETSRAIGRQLLRHRSFTFQEFSQRYSSDIGFEDIELRGEPEKNRQSSKERLATIFYDDQEDFRYRHSEDSKMNSGLPFTAMVRAKSAINDIQEAYDKLIRAGVASETARMILPGCTTTTIHMTGNVRSWIHFLDLRDDDATQKEARLVANKIGKIFQEEFPVTSKAIGFNYNNE